MKKEQMVGFLEEFLEACKEHPQALPQAYNGPWEDARTPDSVLVLKWGRWLEGVADDFQVPMARIFEMLARALEAVKKDVGFDIGMAAKLIFPLVARMGVCRDDGPCAGAPAIIAALERSDILHRQQQEVFQELLTALLLDDRAVSEVLATVNKIASGGGRD